MAFNNWQFFDKVEEQIENNEWGYLVLIMVCAVLTRLLFYRGITNPDGIQLLNYAQSTSINTVSQLNLNLLRIFGTNMVFVNLVFVVLLIAGFYAVVSRLVKYHSMRILGTWMFATSMFLYDFTRMGSLDRNLAVLFMMAAMYLGFAGIKRESSEMTLTERLNAIAAFVFMIIFPLVIWQGGIVIMPVLSLSYLVFFGYLRFSRISVDNLPSLEKTKPDWLMFSIMILLFVASIFIVVIGWKDLSTLFTGIMRDRPYTLELQSILSMGLMLELVIFVVVVGLTLTFMWRRALDKHTLTMCAGMLLFGFFSAFLFRRMILFAIIPCYVLLTYYLDYYIYTHDFRSLPFLNNTQQNKINPLLYICIAIFMTLISVLAASNYFGQRPLDMQGIHDAMAVVDNRSDVTCVFGWWDNGAVYNYYTNKTIQYQGSPPVNMTAYSDILTGKLPQWCIAVFSASDVMVAEWATKTNASTWAINKSGSGQEMILKSKMETYYIWG